MSTTARPENVAGSSLTELLAGFGVPEVDVTVTGVSHDSRTIAPGDLYVGLMGTRHHGARFAENAQLAGAVALLTDAEGAVIAQNCAMPIVVVADPRQAMAYAAARCYGNPADQLTTFAVTGTNGKTTTIGMLAAATSNAGMSTGTIGTLGFAIDGVEVESARTTVTTPESAELQALLAIMLERGASAVAMEASSHALSLNRVDAIRFNVAGFTNFGRDHLDFHHTLEEYFDAKARLFTPEHAQTAVIFADDEAGQEMLRRSRESGVPTLSVGTKPGHDYSVSHAVPAGTGSTFTVQHRGRDITAATALPGDYNVRNAATALAMMIESGIDPEAAASGLRSAVIPGRMEPIELGADAPRVYVDFAHTPQAIESALTAVDAPDGRIFVVVGAGGDRDATKRPLMGQAAAHGGDVVIITDDNPRTEPPERIRAAVLAGARQAGAEAIDGGDRRSAITLALQQATPADVIAILGKGHESTQEINGELIEFDDRVVAREQWRRVCEERS